MDLFYHTVHIINARDYTTEQLDAWAPEDPDEKQWNHSLQKHYTVVAVENDEIVGFGDIDSAGYLDRLYVHARHQGKGIASAICDQLERSNNGSVTMHASATARTFFEKRGYRVVKQQTVERRGVKMTNYVMRKS